MRAVIAAMRERGFEMFSLTWELQFGAWVAEFWRRPASNAIGANAPTAPQAVRAAARAALEREVQA